MENKLEQKLPPILYYEGYYYIAKKSNDGITFRIDMDYNYNGFKNMKDLVMYYNYAEYGRINEFSINNER